MQNPPKTIEDALKILLSILDDDTRAMFGGRSEHEIKHYHCTAGVLIRKQFKLSEGNDELIESCRNYSGRYDLDGKGASIVILEELWKILRHTTH
jgi:hypothetical protein